MIAWVGSRSDTRANSSPSASRSCRAGWNRMASAWESGSRGGGGRADHTTTTHQRRNASKNNTIPERDMRQRVDNKSFAQG